MTYQLIKFYSTRTAANKRAKEYRVRYGIETTVHEEQVNGRKRYGAYYKVPSKLGLFGA